MLNLRTTLIIPVHKAERLAPEMYLEFTSIILLVLGLNQRIQPKKQPAKIKRACMTEQMILDAESADYRNH